MRRVSTDGASSTSPGCDGGRATTAVDRHANEVQNLLEKRPLLHIYSKNPSILSLSPCSARLAVGTRASHALPTLELQSKGVLPPPFLRAGIPAGKVQEILSACTRSAQSVLSKDITIDPVGDKVGKKSD